jgi:hypothetical protein
MLLLILSNMIIFFVIMIPYHSCITKHLIVIVINRHGRDGKIGTRN